MKILKYSLSLVVMLFVITSCEKHEIKFTQEIPFNSETQAAFELNYIVNLTTDASNNITKVELNDEIIYRSDITPYNCAPNVGGTAGRFFIVNKGKSNIKLYQGVSPNYTLVYDNEFDLDGGKYYNVFIHSFKQAPIVINNGYPYKKDPVHKDSCGYVRFYNFLYETDSTPTTLRLQYKRLDHFTADKWVDVGTPVAFGECTDWETIVIKRPTGIVNGSVRVDYRIHIIDDQGNDMGRLQIRGTGSSYSNYSDWWTCYIGRFQHHIFKGYRAKNTLRAGVTTVWAW
ncbi:MAG: hypothetical protein LBQ28_00630 [Prevotellaceae bacterium]|jgi:hypothetical protein|nr:hypothetical protein [Prevotellaceae bacterium]